MPTYRANNGSIGWPTRRLASWAATNSISSIADLQTWLTANVTTLAQARVVLLELCVAMVQIANDGE